MELADNPEITLTNAPVPEPSVVCGSESDGFAVKFQHTPLAEMGDDPSQRTSPPEMAVFAVTEVIAVVLTPAEGSNCTFSRSAL